MRRNLPNCTYCQKSLSCKSAKYCKSCTSKRRMTPEMRKRISIARSGRKNHFFGKKHSIETKQKISKQKELELSKKPKELIESHTQKMRDAAYKKYSELTEEEKAKKESIELPIIQGDQLYPYLIQAFS